MDTKVSNHESDEARTRRAEAGARSVTVRKERNEWIEIVYNRQRRRARLGNVSPTAYAQQFYRNRRKP
ncbi:transposase IS3/IS911 family protein [Methylocaldum marinum]|uniref:Transposase IS3/IS911 family protein n=1 Tax=Methylocaldum marinum TaxID=1432792 RepID=A0A250KQ92_9GAMM|nr:transposase IS3/IS911 family protein [Methylocaldum marinum]